MSTGRCKRCVLPELHPEIRLDGMHALVMGSFLATKARTPEAESVGALVGERSS